MSYFGRVTRLDFKKNYIIALFDENEANVSDVGRMFNSSVQVVNDQRRENEELKSNVFLEAETRKVGTDLFELSETGNTL